MDFAKLSEKDLQQYLKDRAVPFSGLRWLELVKYCERAEALEIEVDPHGIL